MRGAGDDGELGVGDRAVEGDRVLERHHVVVADGDQRARRRSGRGPRSGCAARSCPSRRTWRRTRASGRHRRASARRRRRGTSPRLARRIHAGQHLLDADGQAGDVVVRADDDQPAHEVGTLDRDEQADDAAVAPADEVGGPADDALEEGDRVVGHVLVVQRPVHVRRVAVAPPLRSRTRGSAPPTPGTAAPTSRWWHMPPCNSSSGSPSPASSYQVRRPRTSTYRPMTPLSSPAERRRASRGARSVPAPCPMKNASPPPVASLPRPRAIFAIVTDPAGQVAIDGSHMLVAAPQPSASRRSATRSRSTWTATRSAICRSASTRCSTR